MKSRGLILEAFIAATVGVMHVPAHSAGNVELIDYGTIRGWACSPDTPNNAAEILIKRDDGVVMATVSADLNREDAVRQACGSSNNLHGFQYNWIVYKVVVAGNGNPTDWHKVQVFLKRANGAYEELPGSGKNLYFGYGIPVPSLDVNDWPPQHSNTPVSPAAVKSPPITVWPYNTPPNNLPQPFPDWPCFSFCRSANFAGRLSASSETEIKHNEYFLDETASDLIQLRNNERYEEIKRVDDNLAEEFLRSLND